MLDNNNYQIFRSSITVPRPTAQQVLPVAVAYAFRKSLPKKGRTFRITRRLLPLFTTIGWLTRKSIFLSQSTFCQIEPTKGNTPSVASTHLIRCVYQGTSTTRRVVLHSCAQFGVTFWCTVWPHILVHLFGLTLASTAFVDNCSGDSPLGCSALKRSPTII